MVLKHKKIQAIIIIYILLILISLFLCFRERKVLILNKRNKIEVEEYLEEYTITEKSNNYHINYYIIKSNKEVRKISCGRDWNKGCIYVYYSIIDTKPDKLILYEGEDKKEELAKFIIENGYSEKKIGKLCLVLSTIGFIACSVKILKQK